VSKEKTDNGTDPVGAEVTEPAGSAPAANEQPAAKAPEKEPEQPTVVIRDKRKVRDTGKPAETEAPVVEEKPTADEVPVTVEAGGTVLGAELEALRGNVDELTRDLQRITAEYANYRKRVDRDRGLVGEQAMGTVLAALLPVLDDVDRAREHGDLVGPFGSVAEQLVNALTKFGLTPFGEKGDTFDPTRHEAVTHEISAEVKEPTCVGIMRRGYLLGDRLLRPALVAVADPE
jgi:molecular chaperone GrpE